MWIESVNGKHLINSNYIKYFEVRDFKPSGAKELSKYKNDSSAKLEIVAVMSEENDFYPRFIRIAIVKDFDCVRNFFRTIMDDSATIFVRNYND